MSILDQKAELETQEDDSMSRRLERIGHSLRDDGLLDGEIAGEPYEHPNNSNKMKLDVIIPFDGETKTFVMDVPRDDSDEYQFNRILRYVGGNLTAYGNQLNGSTIPVTYDGTWKIDIPEPEPRLRERILTERIIEKSKKGANAAIFTFGWIAATGFAFGLPALVVGGLWIEQMIGTTAAIALGMMFAILWVHLMEYIDTT